MLSHVGLGNETLFVTAIGLCVWVKAITSDWVKNRLLRKVSSVFTVVCKSFRKTKTYGYPSGFYDTSPY